MLSTGKTPALITTRGSVGAARRVLARFTAVAATTTAVLTGLLAGAAGAAPADDAHFVPKATEVSWDGDVATVSFLEVDVELEGDETTISVKVTAEVNAVCTRGESTLFVRRSATALDVTNYPIGDDGTVAGTAKVPLEVKVVPLPGYSCVTRNVSLTAVLEDFWTGATLVHKS
jgi:hypothetical protein